MRAIHPPFLVVLTLAVGLSCAQAAAESIATPAPTTAAAASDRDLAEQACVIGEEKFLPGDYYYCLAGQAYGQGHFDRAHTFFTTAASWASKPAQYVLGMMALHGDHQPVNRPLALAWFSLAAERGQASYVAIQRANLAQSSVADQRAADALLQTMRPTYADAEAARLAERRYHEGMAALQIKSARPSVQCLSGVGSPTGDDGGSASTGPINASVVCLQIQQLVTTIDQTAPRVFDGWGGHVSVGAVQAAATPAAPARAH